MKKAVICPECKQTFSLKTLKKVPLDKSSILFKKYKFACPSCNTTLKPSLNVEKTAKNRMIFYKLAIIIFALPAYILHKQNYHVVAFLMVILPQIYVVYLHYLAYKFKTENVLGDEFLIMDIDVTP